MNQYQQELARLLKLSTLTPSCYTPSNAVKSGKHAAVFVGGKPFMLTGPADDMTSMSQARQLSLSLAFKMGAKALGRNGYVEYGTIDGGDIIWMESHSSLSGSLQGVLESGDESGDLKAIVLGDNPSKGFAVLLSTVTALARIIDPNAPVLDDGIYLSSLARQCA